MASASLGGSGGGRVEARAPVHMSFVVNGASGAATPCAAAPRRFKKVVRSANAAAGFVADDSNVTVKRAVVRRGVGRALEFGRCMPQSSFRARLTRFFGAVLCTILVSVSLTVF